MAHWFQYKPVAIQTSRKMARMLSRQEAAAKIKT
jgi:hypothetical protein